ncbi:MAG: PAS domain S-box protein [Spirochaetaceae bacterium]|nr:MAG: PAS domain S-box protein [Spirochaetaceae bacterium]
MRQNGSRAILLVEDEPLIAMAEKMILERAGYTVVTTGTGEKAVEIVAADTTVELILMDIDLGPGMRGTEAAALILAERDLPLVFLSSHTEPEIVEQTEGITSYGYIVKNSDETVLLASIRMAFRLHETRRTVGDTFTHSLNGLCVHRLIRDEHGEPKDCEYLQVNGAFEKHTGLAVREVTGRTIRDLFPGPSANDVIRLYGEILAGRAASRQEFFFAPTGSWFELSVFPTRDDEFTVVVHNITERWKSKESLRESERRIQDLFDNMNDAFAVHEIIRDRDGKAVDYRFTEVNREFAARLGMAPDDIVGHTALELFPQTERTWIDAFGRVADSGKPEQITRYSRELGKHFESRLYRPKQGCCAGIFIDVTERVHAAQRMNRHQRELDEINRIGAMGIFTRPPEQLNREAVRFCSAIGAQAGWGIVNARLQSEAAETDRRFRTISDNAVYGNAIADLHGNLIYVNRFFAEIHGYEPEELVGCHVSVFHSAAQMETVERMLSSLLEVGRFAPVEILHVRRDGTEFPMLMSGVVIPGDNGEPKYIAASAVDITEHRKAEALVEDAFRRLETIMAAVPVGIIVFDRNARVIEDNAAARRLFRSTGVGDGKALCGEYLRCRHCVAIRGGCGDTPECRDCTINEAIRFVLDGGTESAEQDQQVIQDTGESVWIRFAVLPVALHGERCALLVAQDISTSKKAEADISRQLIEKELLLKEVHHRVKNNVAAVEGLLRQQADSASSEEVRGALYVAAGRVRGLSELYQKLLVSGDHREIPVKEYLSDLIGAILRVFPERTSVGVNTDISDFPVDPKTAVALGIILNELMTNAFKYAFVGRETGRISIGLTREGGDVTFTVKDDGVGFPAGFDPDEPPAGAGFGLTLVTMLAEQLRGTCRTECDGGTRTVVRFSAYV